MSSRVTRSATRRAEGSTVAAAASSPTPHPVIHTPINPRKRKATDPEPNLNNISGRSANSGGRCKKRKTLNESSSLPKASKSFKSKAKDPQSMAKPGYITLCSSLIYDTDDGLSPTGEKEKSPPPAPETSGRKSSSRKKKSTEVEAPAISTPSVPKRSKRATTKKQDETGADESQNTLTAGLKGEADPSPEDRDASEDDGPAGRKPFEMDDDDDGGGDPFRGGFLSGHSGMPASMSSTLRALSGYVSGVSQRLGTILEKLKMKKDPSEQLIALQDLSEILLVSNEDNLSGHFNSDQFVQELVKLMQPPEFGPENSEMMLVACRCIANLMEALPQSTGNIVYNGAVEILCQKLLEIQYIDVAEQALTTLEKISVEFPSEIVRKGGLGACLNYLDFFATSTQRTAVTTAANSCKNIPHDSFPTVRDVMPILLNVLSSSDQKVVEQGSICVSRIVESFKYQQDKLEALVSTDLLKAVRRLLQPGTTNLIGPSIHTQFLRVLSITAHSSPKLSMELLKMDIVDTIFQILTSLSPPSGLDDVSSQLDSVVIMQALIHRPREQVSETLNVICELLPAVQNESLSFHDDPVDENIVHNTFAPPLASDVPGSNVKRLELLQDCKEELTRFAIVLFPTLTDAYSSTVNLGVRQKVLTAQMKMLSNLDTTILENALRTVPFASYLASILSQEDHPSLVTSALKAADLLLNRLNLIYGYQFYREGVMAEISKLANKSSEKIDSKPKALKHVTGSQTSKQETLPILVPNASNGDHGSDHENNADRDEGEEEDDDDGDDEEEDDEDDDDDDDDDDDEEGSPRVIHADMSPSPSQSSSSDQPYVRPSLSSASDLNILRAKKFLEVHETTKTKVMRDKAAKILKDLQSLAASIQQCYSNDESKDCKPLFRLLSQHFCGEALETITSSELLQSNVVDVLLEVFSNVDDNKRSRARADFLAIFMSPAQHPNHGVTSTPFHVFIHKLQDLLSRAEHFEVVTIHHNALDNNRSSPSSMLSKQLRIRLVGDENTETPRTFKHQMISIHAIATFKALDDYLRPRLSLEDQPRGTRTREGMSNALAAFAAAAGMPNPHQRLAERYGLASGEAPAVPSPSNALSEALASRKTSKNKPTSNTSETTPMKERPTSSRRSSRRHQRNAANTADSSAVAPERVQSPLECADERHVTDEDDVDANSALDAIVDDLDSGMEAEEATEPHPVNMEIASTGKVTARKEDGTRVATPAQNSTPTAPPRAPPSSHRDALTASGIHPSVASRAMSYATASQASPPDWHIEFSVEDRPVTYETTIYRAVNNPNVQSSDPTARNIWSAVHTITFKKVAGPPPPETTSANEILAESDKDSRSLPTSLHEHPETSKILRLLNILHQVTANFDDVLDDSLEKVQLNVEPVSQFVNTKLTAKLNRQLEEPLIVASNCLPSWSEDLARLYPFLFPFETRHLFLQSTSFGYARSIGRWQNQSTEDTRRHPHRDDRPYQGRLQRQKVRISRTRILESAQKVMELYGGSSSVLEVEYFEEVGTGLGPTLEFYSTVSKEFSKKKIKMWRENDSNENDEYAFGKLGLFPAPMTVAFTDTESGKKILHHFKMLGKFIARSMLDSRIIDVSLNPTFFRLDDQPNTVPLSLGAVKTVDADLAKSLKLLKQYANAKEEVESQSRLSEKQRNKAIRNIAINGATLDDLALDFTLPGYPSIELIPDGANTPLTIENVGSYIERVVDVTLGSGVRQQAEQFRIGFSEVFNYSALKAFTPSELVMLFGRNEEDWSIETLLDSIKADHGFNMDSKSVRNLLQVMSELTLPQRRDFLQFVTGSPKLPIGGK